MPQSRSYYPGAYYHVFVRGNNYQDIFLKDKNRLRFLKRVREYKEKYNQTLFSYILMNNHFHFSGRQSGDVPASKFMQALNTGYTMYFNFKYKKVGHLFQGRFQYVTLESDSQLYYLTCYHHLNPVRAGIVEKPEAYPWSSYREFLGLGKMDSG